ncbi:CoA-binding protein [Corallococcus sp. CA054B]|uniref:CoA-binding protein n=1 Tax=Corallococcus sp. CA054B TaxID=2316734 RepID=UPI000EA3AE40|nr:CoA-binding protein [Corallococcus sp. CA054B]RKG57374.1 CoA-binding protein [Corallococcus sp. CA054B]
MDDWRKNLIDDAEGIGELLARTKRIAVLGIRPEAQADKPAHAIPRFLQDHGFVILPVPTHGEQGSILGTPISISLTDLPGDVDVVQVFLRPDDINAHVDAMLAKKPYAVWFQLGIRNDAAAERLARAGIRVVQDHCMKVEWKKRHPDAR